MGLTWELSNSYCGVDRGTLVSYNICRGYGFSTKMVLGLSIPSFSSSASPVKKLCGINSDFQLLLQDEDKLTCRYSSGPPFRKASLILNTA